MKKEMEKENILEDTYESEDIRWSTINKMKEHWYLTKDEDQDHKENSSSSSQKDEGE